MIPDILQRMALALAIGLLVGLERGWQEREGKAGSRVAGIRTYALIGLLGGFSGALVPAAGGVFLGLIALGFAGGFSLFEWKKAAETGNVSATGFVAGLLVFALSAYAALGNQIAAAAAAVAATLVLAEREFLHSLLKRVEWVDLRAALFLLVMTVILLPILPDRSFDPWDALNPHQLWLMTILIAVTSYCGYIAIKLAGSANGLLFAGLAGGLVSSTTVTWSFAHLAKGASGMRAGFVTGILASWAISLFRMTVIAVVIAPAIAPALISLVGPAFVVVAIAGAIFYRMAERSIRQAELPLKDPFDIISILKFGLLLAAIMFAAKWLMVSFGPTSMFPLAAFSGLADVDPITLSMAQAAGHHSMAFSQAALVILTAAAANLVAKCALAVSFGGIRFALPLLATAVVAAIAAAPIALLWASLASEDEFDPDQ